jgi:hypothetical protein
LSGLDHIVRKLFYKKIIDNWLERNQKKDCQSAYENRYVKLIQAVGLTDISLFNVGEPLFLLVDFGVLRENLHY